MRKRKTIGKRRVAADSQRIPKAKTARNDPLDPHDESRGDGAQKAAGLADFSCKYGATFGRIELIRIANGQIQRLQLHQETVRDTAIRVTDLKHLAELFDQHG